MPQPQNLQKASLNEVGGQGKVVEVQFNPQTLKLNFSNQWKGGDQPQGSSTQFVGTSTTKLSMELWFDVMLQLPKGADDPRGDVRNLTSQVAYFMTVQNPNDPKQENRVPPKLKFQWGSFLFSGTMDSMDETIDLFSADGVPLRSSVSINLTKHDLTFEFAGASGTPSQAAGTTPLSLAKAGDTLQQMAAKAGISNWQGVAQANGITNPRFIQPGTMVNLSVTA
ncbi:MAG: LysM domain-containing protein [Acidobacteriia bacterium]|nr:LysM domain-containing protein [Terriglobia bacterium]